jgi:hypothetical protein
MGHSFMPKTLDDLLPLLKRRLKKEGAPGAFEKLEEYFSTVAAEVEVLRKKTHVTQWEFAARSGSTKPRSAASCPGARNLASGACRSKKKS